MVSEGLNGEFSVKLIDLGSAVLLGSELSLVTPPLGTYQYQSPEQHLAQAAAGGGGGGGGGRWMCGLKSDVFTLGLVCLTILTGLGPWSGMPEFAVTPQNERKGAGSNRFLSQVQQHILKRVRSDAVELEPISFVDPTLFWPADKTARLALPRVLISVLQQTLQVANHARPSAQNLADHLALVAQNPTANLAPFPFFKRSA